MQLLVCTKINKNKFTWCQNISATDWEELIPPDDLLSNRKSKLYKGSPNTTFSHLVNQA